MIGPLLVVNVTTLAVVGVGFGSGGKPTLRDAGVLVRGERIAQLVIVAFASPDFVVVDELPPSERGERGWGHSGRT